MWYPTFAPGDKATERGADTPPASPSTGRLSRRLPHGNLPAGSSNGLASPTPAPTVLVHGRSRPLVNLLLYAVAENANPRFHWLDIRPHGETPPHWDPVRLGWLESDRVWTADPAGGLEPDHAKANAALFELVRSDEPPETLAHLADFLRLPSPVQEILGELTGPSGSSLLAVANADRISGAFPDDTLDPILSAFEWAHCSLFVGYTGTSPRAAEHFSHVLRIEGDSPTLWRSARIHFEREAAGGPGRKPGAVSPSDLPFVDRVFRKAHL